MSSEKSANDRHYERFAISMPAQMAQAIRDLCDSEARSHSEFFREAVRVYLAHRQGDINQAGPRLPLRREPAPQPALRSTVASLPSATPPENPFAGFDEWENDAEYNHLLAATVNKHGA